MLLKAYQLLTYSPKDSQFELQGCCSGEVSSWQDTQPSENVCDLASQVLTQPEKNREEQSLKDLKAELLQKQGLTFAVLFLWQATLRCMWGPLLCFQV